MGALSDLAAFASDPNWAAFIPERSEGFNKRHLPAHEDCSPINVESAARHLMPGGTLGFSLPGYESRPGQVDMLRAVARAFNDRANLMIEAGTGVGKSLAYLIPSVLWSYINDTPVVISTATRNLQSQLVASDIPRAIHILDSVINHEKPFRAALLKGRTNYLCLRAVEEIMRDGFFVLPAADQTAFAALVSWIRTTPDGDLDTFFMSYSGSDSGPDGILSRLSCPGEDCSGRCCRYYKRCFVYKARARAAAAHLVVANHALVLAEAAGGSAGGILPSYGRLVLDEAHDLESIATDYLSFELSRPALARILRRLVGRKPTRMLRGARGGILESVLRQFDKGAFSSYAEADEIRALVTKAMALSAEVQSSGEVLFAVLDRLLSVASPKQDLIRFRVKQLAGMVKTSLIRQYSMHGVFTDYPSDKWSETDLRVAADGFENVLAKLLASLELLTKSLSSLSGNGELPFFDALAAQIVGASSALKEFIVSSKFILSATDSSWVFLAERIMTGGRPTARGSLRRAGTFVRLAASPLSVAAQMRELFYEAKDSVVLCSATLRTGSSFEYMARRLGFESACNKDGVMMTPDSVAREYRAVVATSPFDYLRQSLVLAPDCLPDPSFDMASYAKELATLLKDLLKVTQGRALVLFTSYEMMNAVATFADSFLLASGIRLLVQGVDGSRECLTGLLRNAGDKAPTVLFGAQSFWEGVDIPGEALSCVVMARLPFPQVGEPITEARCEKIDVEGGSSFRDYILPEAVVKFRQGFGRLIRSKSDRGVVVIADPRVVTKNYGAMFRKSIPASVHTVSTLPELLARVETFFE